jgi:hypothetical protein
MFTYNWHNIFQFFFVAQDFNSSLDHLIVEVSNSQTIRHTPSKTPLNEWSVHSRACSINNTYQTQGLNIHALSRIWARNYRNRKATELCLRPKGHWDWLKLTIHVPSFSNCWILVIKSQFTNKTQNVLLLNYFTHEHDRPWGAVHFQRFRDGCERYNKHKECGGEVSLHVKLQLHALWWN